MSEIATGKLVIWLRLQAKRITPDGNRTSIMLSAAADRIEKQEAQITRLENALDTATGTAERYLRELAAANQLIDTIYRSGGEFVDTHIEAYYTAYSGAREGEGK